MKKQDILNQNTIFSQATEWSFCHNALKRLLNKESQSGTSITFCGEQSNAFEKASELNQEAFIALRNSIVPGHLIQTTIQALQMYHFTEVTGTVNMEIQMCLLRAKNQTTELTH